MKPIEAIRLKLKCMEMVEGTELEWWRVIKTVSVYIHWMPTLEIWKRDEVEIALGVVEGKPVWAGDEPYFDGVKTKVSEELMNLPRWSWNPPKPKTVMVELLVEDVKYYAGKSILSFDEIIASISRREEACRKALELLK